MVITRGLLRQCVSLGALVLTIITVKVATPYVTDFVKANPVIRENAAHFIMEVSGWQPPEESESILPAAQRMAIEELKLPQSVKDVLLENNNSEFYRLLGVDQFGEYISTCLSDMLINTLGSVLVFAASYIVIHLVIRWLNLLSRLPIICGLKSDGRRDRRACRRISAFVACRIILSFFTETPMGQMLEAQVNSSIWLSLIYRYNLMNVILGSIINGIL